MSLRKLFFLCASLSIGYQFIPAIALAQTLTVVVDAQFQQLGQRFISDLKDALPNPERERVVFTSRVVSSTEMPAVLRDGGWDLAVISTTVLAGLSTRSAVSAFEIPFLFQTTKSAIDLQQSPVGLAGLGTSTPAGVSGLLYLNAGVNLMTSKTHPRKSSDLLGAKVGVQTPLQVRTFNSLGSSAVILQPSEVPNALRAGSIDAGLLTSANQGTWHFSDVRFMLTDSIKAQVALVATRDASWEQLPFPLRAKVGDAAVAASGRNNAALIESENALFITAKQANVTLVAFEPSDALQASRQWIEQQPLALRDGYVRAYGLARRPDGLRPSAPTTTRQAQAGKIYFATTRGATDDPSVAYHFGDRASDTFSITCGEVDYSPAQGDVRFSGPKDSGVDRCGSRINSLLISGRPVLIFVHGFNNRFSDAIQRAMILKESLGDGMEVLVWSWPSKRDGLTGNYYYDKESAGGNSRQAFLEFLKTLQLGSITKPINILAHSLGGWHTMNVLTGLARDAGRPKFGNVAMAAPDVAVDEFKSSLDRMHAVSRRLSLYACGSDHALEISRNWHDFARAGTGGDSIVIANDRLDSIDVDAKFFSANHSYVFEAGKVLDDLKALVSSDKDAGGRGLSKNATPTGFYWTFP